MTSSPYAQVVQLVGPKPLEVWNKIFIIIIIVTHKLQNVEPFNAERLIKTSRNEPFKN
jgi:hypothetical protein